MTSKTGRVRSLSPDVRPWDGQDEAVLRAVDGVQVNDDLDYTGLFDYEGDETTPARAEASS